MVACPSARSSLLDNLTHTLVGAAIGRAGAHRTTPLATASLMVAANAPDVDILAFVGGEYTALALRRGVTHGIPALVVLPFLVTAGVVAWDRFVRSARKPHSPPVRPGWILLWSTVGLVTHPVLDWMNTYGMRWWLPFDGSWSYGDALFIIDPWIWLGLGGALFVASPPLRRRGKVLWLFLGLATSLLVLGTALVPPGPKVGWVVGLATVGGLRHLRSLSVQGGSENAGVAHARPRWIRAALAAAVVYIGLMAALDGPARTRVAAAAREQGLQVHDILVAPLPGTPLSAEVEVRTDGAYVPGRFRWLGRPQVTLRPDQAVPLLDAPADLAADSAARIVARATEEGDARNYLVWARYPYVRVSPDGPGWRVRFSDARYDRLTASGGLAGVEVRVDVPESSPPAPQR